MCTVPFCIISCLRVLQRLGFESFTAEVESVLKDHKQQQKVRGIVCPL